MKIERKLTGMIISVDEDENITKQEVYEDVIVEEMPWYIKHASKIMVVVGFVIVWFAPAYVAIILLFISYLIVMYGIGKIIQI